MIERWTTFYEIITTNTPIIPKMLRFHKIHQKNSIKKAFRESDLRFMADDTAHAAQKLPAKIPPNISKIFLVGPHRFFIRSGAR